MKDSAEIVIIGGGAIGCSIAYHLTKMGKKDVLVLEKASLTHGCTWHAAGLVGQLRGKQNLTRMMQYSADLYGRLEQETGQATDWRPVGSLRVASSQGRWKEIQRTASTARAFGFELHLLSPSEALELFPLMSTEGVVGAAYIPSDGYVDPSSLTQSLAKGARAGGAVFREGTLVTDILVDDGRVTGVVTDHGTVKCGILVNAAGLWARQVGAIAGVSIPAGVVEHQYMVSEKLPDLPRDLPTFRDPDKLFYLKPEAGGLAIGGWEDDTVPYGMYGLSLDFGRELLESNFDRFAQIAEPAAERLPVLNEVGVRNLINGPIPVSPDGEPVMGRAPELENFYLACGFTAGIAGCGGAGWLMAEWIVEGRPSMDLWAFDVQRFGPQYVSSKVLHERAVESYSSYYKIHWPLEEAESARGLRRSPLYEILKAQGAAYGSKFGWERPNWFAPEGTEPADKGSFGKPNWFDAVAGEHRAIRERVAIIDQSSFGKMELSGPGCAGALDRLAAARVDRPVGRVIYTQLCNERGGIEADLTICRTGEDSYYLITGSGFVIHDRHWIESGLSAGGQFQLRDVTTNIAVLNLCGPLARDVLEKVTPDDVSNAAFSFSTCRSISIGGATVLALRIGYVGELGWELHVPTEFAPHVYEQLWAAGQDLGIRNVGYRAIEGLRLEKGYLYWSADITPDYNPFEAGLGARVALTKDDFIGKEALLELKDKGTGRRLAIFTLDGYRPIYGGEPVLSNDRVIGVTSSAGFGHTVGKSIAYAYLAEDDFQSPSFEIEVFGERYPATRHDGPLYDPGMSRLKS